VTGSEHNFTRPRVLVVGAGLGGLVTAYRLQVEGCAVTLLEQHDRPGGSLVREKFAGFDFEPSLTALPQSSPALGGLLRELGLSSEIDRTPITSVIEIARGRRRPVPVVSLPGRSPLQAWRRRRLRKLIEWFDAKLVARAPEAGVRLDDRSIADFTRLYLGRVREERMFGPLLESLFGLDSLDTSRLLLMLLLDPTGELRISNAGELWALPVALASRLEDLKLDARVSEVDADARGLRLASGEHLQADAVAVAIPAVQVREICPGLLPSERIFFDESSCMQTLQVSVAMPAALGSTLPISWLPRANGGPLAAIIDASPRSGGERSGASSLIRLIARPAQLARHASRDDDSWAERLIRAASQHYPSLADPAREVRVDRAAAAAFGIGHYRRVDAFWRDRASRGGDRPLFFADASLVGPHREATVASAERAAADVLERLRS